MIDITQLRNILFVSQDDQKELAENEAAYSELVDSLNEEHSRYLENIESISKLHSQFATINYDVHEKFMNTHKNAIVIKSYLAEIKMLGIPIKFDLSEANHILDHYLLINEFK
ncbi:MAG: hypothetical protein ACYCSG_03345 [Thermoplasmataceae archaeon]